MDKFMKVTFLQTNTASPIARCRRGMLFWFQGCPAIKISSDSSINDTFDALVYMDGKWQYKGGLPHTNYIIAETQVEINDVLYDDKDLPDKCKHLLQVEKEIDRQKNLINNRDSHIKKLEEQIRESKTDLLIRLGDKIEKILEEGE